MLRASSLEYDGSATIRQLAEAVLSKDESQVIYYEKRLKEMPLRVLAKHGVINSIVTAIE